MTTASLTCPTCGQELNPGDFLCLRCETIVDSSALIDEEFEPPREPTVIRALLCPEPTLSRQVPRPPPAPAEAGLATARKTITRTRVFTLPAGADDLPALLLGLDLRQQSLSSFEAYIISLIDGRTTVEQLRMMAALSKIEIQSILRSLLDREIIKLCEAPPKPKPRAATPEPPGRPPPLPEDLPARRVVNESAPRPPAQERSPALPRRSPPPAPPRLERRQVQPAPRPSPQPAFNPLQKAIALERSGDYAGAIKVLELAIARSDDPAPLFNRLAIAVVKERRDLSAAEDLLQKALALDPDNEVYRQNLMKVLSMSAALTGRHKMPRRRG